LKRKTSSRQSKRRLTVAKSRQRWKTLKFLLSMLLSKKLKLRKRNSLSRRTSKEIMMLLSKVSFSEQMKLLTIKRCREIANRILLVLLRNNKRPLTLEVDLISKQSPQRNHTAPKITLTLQVPQARMTEALLQIKVRELRNQKEK
jgi:hypothetical protein